MLKERKEQERHEVLQRKEDERCRNRILGVESLEDTRSRNLGAIRKSASLLGAVSGFTGCSNTSDSSLGISTVTAQSRVTESQLELRSESFSRSQVSSWRKNRDRAHSEKEDVERSVDKAASFGGRILPEQVKVFSDQVEGVAVLIKEMEKEMDTVPEIEKSLIEDEARRLSRWVSKTGARLRDAEASRISQLDSRGGGGGMLKKIGISVFSGHMLDWSRFRRKFENLTGPESLSESATLAHLEEALPKEAREEIKEVESLKESWEVLERLYGDPLFTSLAVKNKLIDFHPAKGEAWVQIEELAKEIERACKALGSEWERSSLASDSLVLSAMVSKLPATLKIDWDRHVRSNKTRGLQGSSECQDRWKVFRQWLEEEKEVAWETKRRVLTEEMGRSITAVQASPKSEVIIYTCAKCQGAHKTSNCKASPTSGHGGVYHTQGQGMDRPPLNKTLRSRAGMEQLKADLLIKWGPCPTCDEVHYTKRNFEFGPAEEGGATYRGDMDWPTFSFKDCSSFREVTTVPADRMSLVESQNGCVICTSRQHGTKRCMHVEKHSRIRM